MTCSTRTVENAKSGNPLRVQTPMPLKTHWLPSRQEQRTTGWNGTATTTIWKCRRIVAATVTPLMDGIASDAVIDAAYAWLCRRRTDYSPPNDVWRLR